MLLHCDWWMLWLAHVVVQLAIQLSQTLLFGHRGESFSLETSAGLESVVVEAVVEGVRISMIKDRSENGFLNEA